MLEIKKLETNEIEVKDIDKSHYVVYNSSQKEQFLKDMGEEALKYIDLIDWDE